jgi:hypothetical protein
MANYLYKPITEMPGNSGKSASASGMTRFVINKRQRIRKDGDGGTPPTTPTPKPIAPSTPPKNTLSTGPMEAAKAGALRNQPAPTLKQQVQQLFPQGNLIQAPQRQATRQAQNNYLQANATPTPASQTYNPRVWNTDTQSSPGMQTIKTPQNAWYNNLNNKAVQDSYIAMGFPAGGQAQMANQNGYLVGQVGNPMGNPPSAISLSQYKPGYGRLNGTYKSMKKSQGAKMSNMRKGYYNWGKIVSPALDVVSDAASGVRAVIKSPEVRSAVADAARGVAASTRQVRGAVGEAVRNRRVASTPVVVEVITEAPKKKRVRSSGKASTPPVVTPTTPTGDLGSELGAADVQIGSFNRGVRGPLQRFVARTAGRIAGLPYEGLARFRQVRADAAGAAATSAKAEQRKLVREALKQRRAARAWEASRVGHETDRLAALTSAGKVGNEAGESAARAYIPIRNTAAALALLGGGYAANQYLGKRMNKGMYKGNSEGSKKMNGSALAAMLMNTGRGTAEGIRSGGYEAQSIGPREQTKLLNMLMQMKTLLVRDPENPKMNPERKPSASRSPMKAPNYGNSGGVSDPENPYFSAKTPARRSSNTGQGGMKKGINWAKLSSRVLGTAADAVRDNASRVNSAVGYSSLHNGPRPRPGRLTTKPWDSNKPAFPAAYLSDAQANKISRLAGRAYNFGENTLARRSDNLLDPRMERAYNNKKNNSAKAAISGLSTLAALSLAASLQNRNKRTSAAGSRGVAKGMSKGMYKNAGSMNPSALAAMLMATGRGTAGGMRNGGYEAQSIGPRMQDQRLRMLMQRGGIIRDPENEQYMPMPTRTMTPPRRPTTTPQTRIDPANPYFMPYATRTRMPTATPLPNTSKRMSKSISNIYQGSTKHVVGGYRGAMGKSFYKSAAARPTQATKNHRSSKFGI